MNLKQETLDYDVVVIGGGGAGLRAALEAHKLGAETAVVTKEKIGVSGCTAKSVSELSAYSCSLGHADPRDVPYQHFRDTVDQGRKCVNENLCRILAEEAPKRFLEIVAMGGKFKKNGDKFEQLLADASTLPRACHNGADTGREIASILRAACLEQGIPKFENVFITKLLICQGSVVGAAGLDLEREIFVVFRAKSIVLATGGGGQIFSLTAHPRDVTGEGYCMAYEAGAELVNMEFIQIGPALVHPVKGYLLVTRFWKLNPKLTNSQGESFLAKYLPPGMLEKDVIEAKQFAFPFIFGYPAMHLDIAMHKEIREGRGTENGGVYLDVSHNSPELIEKTVPVTFRWLLERGVDIRKQPIEVAPVVQCFIGGVKFDEKAATNIPGLYVAGEIGGGEHGAARPGGNLLAGSQVFGYIAGRSAAQRALAIEQMRLDPAQVSEEKSRLVSRIGEKDNTGPLIRHVQTLLWNNASVVREENSLRKTLGELCKLRDEALPLIRVKNLRGLVKASQASTAVNLGIIITLSALLRKESRGTHYREDYPRTDSNNWNKIIKIYKHGSGIRASLNKPEELEDFNHREEIIYDEPS